MKRFYNVLITEYKKLCRARVPFITTIFFIFIPLMIGLLMYLAQHPDIAAKLGIVGTKASLFGDNTWNTYFTLLNQIIATIGIIGFGFITSWIFGREYMNHTMKDLLALPAARTMIVVSKFTIVILWSIILCMVLFLSGLVIGYVINLPGWSQQLFIENLIRFFIISGLTVLLNTPVALVAAYGKGIIAPIAFVIVMLILAQFVALIGWGPYFPWSIPGIHSVSDGTRGMQLVFASYIIVFVTFIAGFIGTILQWLHADQP
ncbi:MAG: ABC transporter permease [Bacteroidales bacterium]|nr:ABC transporter permease [Bacteroidales bacterium]